MIGEFALVVFLYSFLVSFINRKVGGAELRSLEKDMKKLLDRAKKGDEKAYRELNRLNSRRMKLSFRTQKYILPVSLVALFFIKSRYAELQWVVFGHSFGWLGSFMIMGILSMMVADRVVRKLLYS